MDSATFLSAWGIPTDLETASRWHPSPRGAGIWEEASSRPLGGHAAFSSRTCHLCQKPVASLCTWVLLADILGMLTREGGRGCCLPVLSKPLVSAGEGGISLQAAYSCNIHTRKMIFMGHNNNKCMTCPAHLLGVKHCSKCFIYIYSKVHCKILKVKIYIL